MAIAMLPALNQREAGLVRHITDGRTRAEAAKMSGYGTTGESQRVAGSRLMCRPAIIRAIEAAREQRARQASGETICGRDEVLGRLSDLARHGETERTRLDALNHLARVHGL